jgi:hypothetical protein
VICRTLDEVRAAALADAAGDEPLDQNGSDLVAAILTPHLTGKDAAA